MKAYVCVRSDPNDPTKIRVIDGIVVESAALAAEVYRLLGKSYGTTEAEWVETKREDQTERYAGIGDYYNPQSREKFEDGPDRRPRVGQGGKV